VSEHTLVGFRVKADQSCGNRIKFACDCRSKVILVGSAAVLEKTTVDHMPLEIIKNTLHGEAKTRVGIEARFLCELGDFGAEFLKRDLFFRCDAFPTHDFGCHQQACALVTLLGHFGIGTIIIVGISEEHLAGNDGDFAVEISDGPAYLRETYEWTEVKPQVHQIQRNKSDADNYILLLSEGRLVNLGNATGHPSRIMDGSFANQVLAQMHLFDKKWADTKADPITVTVLPKKLDEEVAADMVRGFDGVITKLTDVQANYINVDVAGPFKTDDYKY